MVNDSGESDCLFSFPAIFTLHESFFRFLSLRVKLMEKILLDYFFMMIVTLMGIENRFQQIQMDHVKMFSLVFTFHKYFFSPVESFSDTKFQNLTKTAVR
jgi:hypothetical protein